MKKFFTGWLILLIMLGSLDMTGQKVENLLPSLANLKGWELTSEPRVFVGDDLFELINGGAEIYYEYGFVRVVSAQYTDLSFNNIQVEIYEMNDGPSAYGIFSITQQSAGWSEDFGSLSVVTQDYISFWKSKYYVIISWSTRQHPDPPVLTGLADMIAQKMPANGEYPELIQYVKSMEFGEKAIFLKGSLALSNFYYFDYKDIFQIREAAAFSPGGYHFIMIKHGNQEKAIEIITAAKQSVSNNKRFSDITNTFQGFSCVDNKGNFILIRQIENYIAILVDVDKSISIVPLMDEFTLRIEKSTK